MSSSSSSQTGWHPAPAYHIKALRGWMNDPCAPGFDSTTNTHHLFYQWNPKSCDWGNISWGHLISQDGLHWRHNAHEPVLEPDQPYDQEGIFTGCFYPTGPLGETGQLTVLYTSVTTLPIHWTLPYIRNSEGLALATSTDSGRTWHKSDINPILEGEPQDIVVTGFRDPYLAEWPALDRLRGKKSLYGILSGGLRGKGPTVFIYVVEPANLGKWTYLGPLIDVESCFRPSPQWSGDLGRNWECANFITLSDDAAEMHLLTFGAEGGVPWGSNEPDRDQNSTQIPLWLAGTLAATPDGPKLNYELSGILDHGCFYAPNTFEHPATKKRIAWGWLKEEELTLERREAKGWTGHLSLQRELFLFTAHNVKRALKTRLEDIESIKVIADGSAQEGTKTVMTLGIRPWTELRSLRPKLPITWSSIDGSRGRGHLAKLHSPHWELEATIKIGETCGRIGFVLSHNKDASLHTSIFFSPQEETIAVDKSLSNDESDIKKDHVGGPFTLFVTESNGAEVIEELHIRIFRDGDTLEIFANDRFALSTMIYVDNPCYGISWFAENAGSSTVFESIRIWENLQRVVIEDDAGSVEFSQARL